MRPQWHRGDVVWRQELWVRRELAELVHTWARRHAVECGINHLKRNRAVATRYDKLACRYEAAVHIAAINERLLPDL